MPEEVRDTVETPAGSSDNAEIIPGYTSIESFTKDGFKVLMEAIRHSNALPTGRDWNFYTLSDTFTKIINDESSSVLRLMNHIMRCNDIEINIRNRILDEKTELVVETNDIILEKVANNIDEVNGIRKAVQAPIVIQTVSAELPVNGSWNRPSATNITINPTSAQTLGKNCIKLITAKNIVRPQKCFKSKIDNSNKYPWCPKITEKPNSLKPLAIFLEESVNGEEFSHPYEFELDRFAPLPEQLLEEIAEFPKNISETPLVEINTPEQLDELLEILRGCKEFGVDLEHHSYRSFMGLTCLLQISTKDKDYLIDALTLRDELCILNEVFTKNNIVKIFHGADRDIEWLQRDLSLYVVNMFDTHQAAKVLQYSGLSLAFLMKKFCNILPNKQFQLADWRIRPLPEEFKAYAREDTHYLIYIYKMLKKELLQKGNKSDNLLKSVIERSTEICKKRYFKPILREDSHMNMYRRCKKMFDNRQLYALKEMYAWRDNLAREEDESLAYVLPNHMLLQISEALPREMQGILACCNPVPPLVRSHLLELHQIILKARDQPLERAILKDRTTGRGVLKKVSKINVDSSLHCPHDISKTNEFRDDLPTLLDSADMKSANKNLADVSLAIEKSSCSLFNTLGGCDEVFNERRTFKNLCGFAYFSPYERYKLVKPFVEEEEKLAESKKREEEAKTNNETTKDERSDEDRIASIRNHFMELSKKFSEELEAKKQEEEEMAKSLIEMGGSRKRKRDFDNEDVDLHQQFQENSFDTPAPNMTKISQRFNSKSKKRARKRKYNEMCATSDNQEQPGQIYHNKKKKRNQKQQANQGKLPMNQNQEQHQQYHHQHQNIQQPRAGNRFDQNLPRFKKRKNNQNKKQASEQNAGKFMPYDYASVDFRQFQGGAGTATGAINVKANFKTKGRKKIGNRGNKSAIFNDISRGRGKGPGKQSR